MAVLSDKQMLWLVGGGAVVLYLVYKNAASVGKSVGIAAGQATGGAVTGAAQGVIQAATGIPLTDAEKCAYARKNGNSYDASLYCDVSTYLNYLVTGK